MPRRLSSYLRTERLRAGFSQQELADLFGMDRSVVTKAEAARPPTLRLAIAVEIVFGRSGLDVFPAHYGRVKKDVLKRALALEETLRGRDDPTSLKKRKLLGALIDRAQDNSSHL